MVTMWKVCIILGKNKTFTPPLNITLWLKRGGGAKKDWQKCIRTRFIHIMYYICTDFGAKIKLTGQVLIIQPWIDQFEGHHLQDNELISWNGEGDFIPYVHTPLPLLFLIAQFLGILTPLPPSQLASNVNLCRTDFRWRRWT